MHEQQFVLEKENIVFNEKQWAKNEKKNSAIIFFMSAAVARLHHRVMQGPCWWGPFFFKNAKFCISIVGPQSQTADEG